ncbi:MAG: site-specific integrase [Bacteroidetes bacterium]|nr:site-specific integrase [Bacteroidota bacterium]MDA1122457.1 site-specific integrase [Bacteroidota bacterium]
MRLTHNRKTTSIGTGYSVPQKYWDDKNRRIRTSFQGFENVTRVNNQIEKEKSRALDIVTKLNDKGQLRYASIAQVKNSIVISKSSIQSVFGYTQKLINDLLEKNKIGNARSYRNVLREIKKFRNNRDLSFAELNYDFLNRLEKAYLARGNSENGLAVYMRTIRAIYNKAIKDGIAEKEAYPFESYRIKTKPTKKRAITYEAIQKIANLKLKENDPLFETRNIFLLSFYLMGAPFINVAFLKMENIVDGRIQYKRKKTGRF